MKEHTCVDCGEKEIILLEFDHISGIKINTISSMVRIGCSIKTIEEEISKCQVRCVGCHRKKTAKQFGWNKE